MKASLTWRIGLAVLIQTAVLIAMIGVRQWTLATGTPVVLQTAPVDPRSLFRGDYVRFNYAISTLDLDELAGDDEFSRHDTVFVVLSSPNQRFWTPVSIHHERPNPTEGTAIIKGEVRRQQGTCRDVASRAWRTCRLLSVRYGIENYFVPEGEGRALEVPSSDEEVSIEVAVDRFGNAGIKAVLVDGEPRYVESLF